MSNDFFSLKNNHKARHILWYSHSPPPCKKKFNRLSIKGNKQYVKDNSPTNFSTSSLEKEILSQHPATSMRCAHALYLPVEKEQVIKKTEEVFEHQQ